MKKLLALSYKGSRQYIQGGDIFNALTDSSSEITNQAEVFINRLVFRRYARHACELTTERPENMETVVGQVRFRSLSDGTLIDGWVVEKAIPVSDRQVFDESLLLAAATLDQEGRSASLADRSMYTPIEDVIALTKYLNCSVSPQVRGNWIFGQVDLIEPLSDNYRSLKIQMKSLIVDKFSVNDILLDGRQIGAIRFIVGTP